MAVLGIDFDHTLVEGDKMIPGARDAINLLREKGHRILIHSCNSPSWVEKIMNNLDMRYDWIWGATPGYEGKKPLCDLYIDDKGYHFKGDWKEAVCEITDRVEGLDNRKVDGVMCGGKATGAKL